MALIDQFTLSQDATFVNRITAAIVERATTTAANNNPSRSTLAAAILQDPTLWGTKIANGVASDNAVATAAGSPPVQANVTDAQINAAITALYDSYADALR